MNELDGRIWKSMIGPRIWAIRKQDEKEFIREIKAYYARNNPGLTPIRVEPPFIILRDNRGN